MNELVLVTGATGFLGTHIVTALLSAGYSVRAAGRDVGRAARRFAAFVPEEAATRLGFVGLALEEDAGWSEAAAGCAYVVHTASPVPSGPVKDASHVVGPAVEGTLRALRAAHAAGARRVVVTSSTAAVLWGRLRDGSEVYDERHWSILDDSVAAYERSKTLAERAAWEYVDELPEDRRFELVTLLPGALLGPLLDERSSVSGEIVRALLARDFPGVPDLGFALADVRDVARMHVEALTRPDAAGQRFILAGEHTPMREIAEILRRHYGPKGFRVPTRRLPSWLVKLIGLWNPTAALTARELGKRQDVSDARARATLGWAPRTTEEMVVATADSMIALRLVS